MSNKRMRDEIRMILHLFINILVGVAAASLWRLTTLFFARPGKPRLIMLNNALNCSLSFLKRVLLRKITIKGHAGEEWR